MSTKIFYFSTTGNSLALARDLGERLGDTELISIPKVIGEHTDTKAQTIGFVFPVHAWGLPNMVTEFLRKLTLDKHQYIFAIATCGGTPGRTLLQLRGILRKAGGDLNAGFVTKEGANTVTESPGIVSFMKNISRREYQSGKERLDDMLSFIEKRKYHKPETSSLAANFFGGLMYGMGSLAAESFKSMDKNFYVDDKCTLCRTCEKICPKANIKIEGGKPVWNHNCGMCNACIQWCPQQAIHITNESCRYRNPDITSEDLMLR